MDLFNLWFYNVFELLLRISAFRNIHRTIFWDSTAITTIIFWVTLHFTLHPICLKKLANLTQTNAKSDGFKSRLAVCIFDNFIIVL